MKFSKHENGHDIMVTEIFPNAPAKYDVHIYKHAGNQYTYSAGEIGIRLGHVEADSDMEACRLIEEKINETLDTLYGFLCERANTKTVTVYMPVAEALEKVNM